MRPVNPEKSRARVLAALGCVDHIVLFGDDTPLELITGLLPDVLVKGADWAVAEIVGAQEVMAAGGQVVTIDLVAKISTTGIIKKIKNKSG
jgi:rfaE bifunctional protein nucleotidyltransferase chain/domain